eukprot:TRINITY_DN102860_c0_g1_i1.p1 TRINITY_DN102860_c0_g1~~TRINITY_DN102860_c0_g1_i1.p1  ORF type:complete len:1255 (+),score=157.77 TRINITY_DN102860_c0_g1_i1:61-3825(+)
MPVQSCRPRLNGQVFFSQVSVLYAFSFCLLQLVASDDGTYKFKCIDHGATDIDYFCCSQELQFFDVGGSSIPATYVSANTCSGCGANCGCPDAHYGFPASLFDGDVTSTSSLSWWCAVLETNNSFAEVRFALASVPSFYRLLRTSSADWVPRDWTVEQELENGTWLLLDSQVDQAPRNVQGPYMLPMQTRRLQIAFTDESLATAASSWKVNPSQAAFTYGAISQWDVSNVRSCKDLFHDAVSFNEDLDAWDVSGVTSMESMFRNASSFNHEINSWDVSQVIELREMFQGASSFNTDLSRWDVAQASTMINMFRETDTFNADLGRWSVSNVRWMQGMFRSASSFNADLDGWDVSRVEWMSNMFRGATSFNKPLHSWTTSSVTSTAYMFYGATMFNQDLSWNLSNVERIEQMFFRATAFNGDINAWDVSRVTRLDSMFRGATAFNRNIGDWDVSRVTTTENMFREATSFNGDISTWNVSSVVDMRGMFRDTSHFNVDITGWDVSAVTALQRLFADATAFNQDISSWGISSVTSFAGVFSDRTGLSDYFKYLIRHSWSSNPAFLNTFSEASRWEFNGLAPAGYGWVGSDAMCTDLDNSAWNEGIEVGQYPRSDGNTFEQCGARCNALDECKGFVFWFETRHCRTYGACEQLLCRGCSEYANSLAFKSTTSTTTTTATITATATKTATTSRTTVTATSSVTATITMTDTATTRTPTTTATFTVTPSSTSTMTIITLTATSSATTITSSMTVTAASSATMTTTSVTGTAATSVPTASTMIAMTITATPSTTTTTVTVGTVAATETSRTQISHMFTTNAQNTSMETNAIDSLNPSLAISTSTAGIITDISNQTFTASMSSTFASIYVAQTATSSTTGSSFTVLASDLRIPTEENSTLSAFKDPGSSTAPISHEGFLPIEGSFSASTDPGTTNPAPVVQQGSLSIEGSFDSSLCAESLCPLVESALAAQYGLTPDRVVAQCHWQAGPGRRASGVAVVHVHRILFASYIVMGGPVQSQQLEAWSPFCASNASSSFAAHAAFLQTLNASVQVLDSSALVMQAVHDCFTSTSHLTSTSRLDNQTSFAGNPASLSMDANVAGGPTGQEIGPLLIGVGVGMSVVVCGSLAVIFCVKCRPSAPEQSEHNRQRSNLGVVMVVPHASSSRKLRLGGFFGTLRRSITGAGEKASTRAQVVTQTAPTLVRPAVSPAGSSSGQSSTSVVPVKSRITEADLVFNEQCIDEAAALAAALAAAPPSVHGFSDSCA